MGRGFSRWGALMAGVAFLPWEKWLAQLLHPLYVRIRRGSFERNRQRRLFRSETWPKAQGTISSVQWDSSLPREGLWYSYNPQEGYYSGFCWRWFDSAIPMRVRVGGQVVLRYNPSNPDESVVVEYGELSSDFSVPDEVRG